LEHLLLEFLDSFRSLLWSELRVLAALLLDLRRPTSVAVGVCALHDVGYALLDTARRDPVFLIVRELLGTAAIRLVDRALHRAGDLIGIQDRSAGDVTRSAPNGLDERVLRSEEAFLVRIQDRDERDLGHVQAFA